MASKLVDFVAIPLGLPLIACWLLLAKLISILSPFLVFPSLLLAKRLYWAVPFAPYALAQQGKWRGRILRVGFEATYCMNVVRRLLTLPLRTRVPDFYICGFPKAGTTTLANYLREHPQLSGLDGLEWHEVLNKVREGGAAAGRASGARRRGVCLPADAAYRSCRRSLTSSMVFWAAAPALASSTVASSPPF